MPYKTKFREVDVPKTREEFDALGYDANTLRSLGAACYNQISGHVPSWLRSDVVLRGLADVYEKIIEPTLREANPDAIPRERQLHKYMLEGMQKAARKSGNEKMKEYISRKLRSLKQIRGE